MLQALSEFTGIIPGVINMLFTTNPAFNLVFGLYRVTGFVLYRVMYFSQLRKLRCVKNSDLKCEIFNTFIANESYLGIRMWAK